MNGNFVPVGVLREPQLSGKPISPELSVANTEISELRPIGSELHRLVVFLHRLVWVALPMPYTQQCKLSADVIGAEPPGRDYCETRNIGNFNRVVGGGWQLESTR
jgi:hypothetical protein